MPKTVSIHSFRGGTGKSNTTANVAAVLARQGRRIGIVDTDIQSPGIHVLFGVEADDIGRTLNDFLWGKCEVVDAATDVTSSVGGDQGGSVFLIPSSVRTGDIARVLKYGYDVKLLREGFQTLTQALNLDVLLIDTHPGLNEETLLSIAVSDVLLIILRPDQQDYQGTGVTVEVARQLEVPRMGLVVNKVPPSFDPDAVAHSVSETYECEVVGVIPHDESMMTLASGGVFVARYPHHPLTKEYYAIASRILG